MKKILFSILLLSSLSSPSFAMDNYGIYQVLDRSIVRINIWKDFDTDDAWTVSGGSGVVINEIDGAYFILTNLKSSDDSIFGRHMDDWIRKINVILDKKLSIIKQS